MDEKLKQLFEEIEDFCGDLAISHDSPDLQTIIEWFGKYDKIKWKCEPLKDFVLRRCPTCGKMD